MASSAWTRRRSSRDFNIFCDLEVRAGHLLVGGAQVHGIHERLYGRCITEILQRRSGCFPDVSIIRVQRSDDLRDSLFGLHLPQVVQRIRDDLRILIGQLGNPGGRLGRIGLLAAAKSESNNDERGAADKSTRHEDLRGAAEQGQPVTLREPVSCERPSDRAARI
jgi:hypothetical protein